ncbi:geranylgeranyl transferase type-2 subunit beta [Nannochloropsis oceanica]
MSEAPSPPSPPQGGGDGGGKGAAGTAEAEAAAGKASPQGEEEEGGAESTFYEAKHVAFIRGLMDKTDSFEHIVMEHLKMSAVYWALMGMALMGRDLEAEMKLSEIVEWVLLCQHPNGGFGGNTGHDPHLLYTLSAIQILAIAGQLHRVDQDKVAGYVLGLQQPDGSFTGDEWGEVDTRFSYCGLSTLALLGRLSMAGEGGRKGGKEEG